MASEPAIPPPPAADKEMDVMQSISWQLQPRDTPGSKRLSTGDHAALRRIDFKKTGVAVGVVAKLVLNAGLSDTALDRDFARWRLIAHLASLISGTGRARCHDARRSPGRALQEAGFSENRLLRLLAARGDQLHDQLALAVRMLAKKQDKDKRAINLWTIRDLIGPDPVPAEAARRDIARHYYAAEARQRQETSSDD